MPLDAVYELEFQTKDNITLLSVDQASMLGAYAFMLTFEMCVLVSFGVVLVRLRGLNKTHPLVHVLFASILLQVIGYLCLLIYFLQKDIGMDLRLLHKLGTFMIGNAELTLVLHLILLGKGWGIVRAKITTNGTVKIAVYFTLYYTLHGDLVT